MKTSLTSLQHQQEKPGTTVVVKAPPSLVARIGARYGVDPTKVLVTLKNTAFKPVKVGDRFVEATNEELMALLIVADQYQLNPFTREIYAFPDKRGGIIPVVAVDGWIRIINSNPQMDGMDFEFAEDGEWVTCIIWRKDRTRPLRVTEYLEECYRNTDPWKGMPRRMLRHKALIQCGRVAFGFAGIHDEDEAAAIVGAYYEPQAAIGGRREPEIINEATGEVERGQHVDESTGEVLQDAPDTASGPQDEQAGQEQRQPEPERAAAPEKAKDPPPPAPRKRVQSGEKAPAGFDVR